MPIDPRTLKGYQGPGGGRQRPCASCGYDLAGLPADGLCPECGVGFGRMAEHTPGVRAPRSSPPSPGSSSRGPSSPGPHPTRASDHPVPSHAPAHAAAHAPSRAPAGPASSHRLPHAGGMYMEGVTCSKCGYGLGGLKVGAVCPECNHRAEPPSSASVAAARTSACIACGYDLSGLPPGSVCPECGTPNGGSVGPVRGGNARVRRPHHSVLMDMPVATLSSLRLQVAAVCLSWMVWLFAWLGVWLVFWLDYWMGMSWHLPKLAFAVAAGAGVVAGIAQWWAIGGTRERGIGPLLGQTARRRVRAIIAPLVWSLLAGVLFLADRYAGSTVGKVFDVLGYPVSIAGGVALAAVMPIQAELARLLQDDTATNRLIGLTWGMLLAVLFGCFTVLFTSLAGAIPGLLGFGGQLVCTLIMSIAPVLWFGSLIAIMRGFGWAISNRESQLEREARWVARSAEQGQAERQRDAHAFGRDGR